MKVLVSLREALADDGLLGTALPGPSWLPWRTVLLASRGEPLTAEELEIYQRLSGRAVAPSEPVEGLAAAAGRRGGKTRALSILSVYLATLVDYKDVLAPGERGICLFLAPDQRQAKLALQYADAAILQSPFLAGLVTGRTADTIGLSNGIDVEVRAASFRRLRGITAIAALADEIAFFSSDDASANPDSEILAAIRPALATTGGPLIVASSPYRKQGELWELYRRHFGQNGDEILFLKGTARDFNPSLPQSVIDRALERDPVSARAEYLAEFRDDIDSYVSREVVEACVEDGVLERPPSPSHRHFAFVDPAGGSGADSFTMAIGHMEDDIVVLDAVREQRPPFSPDATVNEFAGLLKSYGIRTIVGDRFAGEFVREPFRKLGIQYQLSDLPKSRIYLEALPRLNAGTIRLLANDRLINQIVGLERRHGRTGRDVIDSAPHAHDDVANCVMGLATCAAKAARYGQGALAFNCYTGTVTLPDNLPAPPPDDDSAENILRRAAVAAEQANRKAEAQQCARQVARC
jgi:hypothetical protein